MIARIQKNDMVVVLSGKDKGKQGAVIEVLPKKDKVLVKGVAMVTRHRKARQSGESSGISRQESYLPLSKVMPVCSICKKACRVGSGITEGKRVRNCRQCGNAF